jgi:hypothetical protein
MVPLHSGPWAGHVPVVNAIAGYAAFGVEGFSFEMCDEIYQEGKIGASVRKASYEKWIHAGRGFLKKAPR